MEKACYTYRVDDQVVYVQLEIPNMFCHMHFLRPLVANMGIMCLTDLESRHSALSTSAPRRSISSPAL